MGYYLTKGRPKGAPRPINSHHLPKVPNKRNKSGSTTFRTTALFPRPYAVYTCQDCNTTFPTKQYEYSKIVCRFCGGRNIVANRI